MPEVNVALEALWGRDGRLMFNLCFDLGLNVAGLITTLVIWACLPRRERWPRNGSRY